MHSQVKWDFFFSVLLWDVEGHFLNESLLTNSHKHYAQFVLVPQRTLCGYITFTMDTGYWKKNRNGWTTAVNVLFVIFSCVYLSHRGPLMKYRLQWHWLKVVDDCYVFINEQQVHCNLWHLSSFWSTELNAEWDCVMSISVSVNLQTSGPEVSVHLDCVRTDGFVNIGTNMSRHPCTHT